MKRLVLACLLVSSHGQAADLNPECYTLYDQFLAADYINAGRIAIRMHDMQCWPALQDIPDSQYTQLSISTCDDLVPHVVDMVNAQAANQRERILKIYNAAKMSDEVIEDVAFSWVWSEKKAAELVSKMSPDEKAKRITRDPFAPLASGSSRVLDCSGEARFTSGGIWLIQMYMDRDPDGEDFIGMTGLKELRNY